MVKEEKLKAVEELAKEIEKYSTVCLIDMMKLPTKQLQLIKKEMGNDAIFKICKKSLVVFALKTIKGGRIAELEKSIPKQPGIILTNLPAFKFYKTINKMRYPVFAKEGDSIEKEVRVKPGPTNLLPGPVISELAKVGIIAGVEGGKVAIKKESTIAKKGTLVTKDMAGVLRKLNIEPVDIGINIVVGYENGNIHSRDLLRLVDTYPEKLKEAFNHALSLSIAIEYPTKENVKFLLSKAYQQAKAIEKIGGV